MGLELDVHDALVGEVLGELTLLRKSVEDFKSTIPTVLHQFKETGELVGFRLADQATHVVSELDDRTAKLNSIANEFRDARELLMAELGVNASKQFIVVLDDVSNRIVRSRRIELAGAACLMGIVFAVCDFILKHV